MKFGPVPVMQAQYAVLAHSVSTPEGRLRKGHVLRSEDITALQRAGLKDVIVAQIDDDDVGEDEAATRIAGALCTGCDHFDLTKAATGRVNLHARQTGLFRARATVIDAINQTDEAITLATLADETFVEAGRMVATVKIIPFAVPETVLGSVEKVCHREDKPLDLAPARALRVGLVATTLPVLKTSVMDKTARVLADRLKPGKSLIKQELRVPHEADAVAEALNRLQLDCDLLIVFGASAIVDRRDVIPAALEAAGGNVIRLGMPVDPGNLLLIGNLDGIPVIGAPGCARSPAENGFDWVLERLICGLPVDGDAISGLGVGGLLMEIQSRPQPRDMSGAASSKDVHG